LYKAALQERREAYRTHRESLNYYTQAKQLKEIRDAGGLALPNYHCARDVLKRLDKAFQAFFRRIKRGQKPGFARFKSSRLRQPFRVTVTGTNFWKSVSVSKASAISKSSCIAPGWKD
jgi:putative transposase